MGYFQGAIRHNRAVYIRTMPKARTLRTSFNGGLRTGFGRTEYKCAPAVTIVSRYSSPEELAAAERSRDHATKKAKAKRSRRAKLAENRARAVVLNRERDAKKAAIQAGHKPQPTYRPGMGKDFYDTRQWLELRYAVLAERGAKCECCGATRADGVYIQVDHIRPRHRFPQLELSKANLQVLCRPCNLGKGARYDTDWRSSTTGAITQPLPLKRQINAASGNE